MAKKSTPKKTKRVSKILTAEAAPKDQSPARPRLLSLLSQDEGKLLYRAVFSSPLFVGAFVAKGSLLLDPKLFSLFLLLLVISSFWFKHFSKFSSLKHLLLYIFFLCLHMGAFSVLGAYSQFPQLVVQTAVLGLLPSFLLAAALLAKNSELLEKAGFVRAKSHVSKKGISSNRPAGATRFFSVFLMLLPGLVIFAGLLSVLPIYFLLIAIVLARTPALAQAFQDRTMEDRALYSGALKLAALASMLMVVAGFLSRS